MLVAPPGTGKTVIACALIAERKLPTLILAHSKPRLEQWRTQLQTLLGLPSKQIGQRGGGRRKRTGIVDLAMIQSLEAVDDLEAFFSGYGLVVVDECHRLPAFSFAAAVRRAPVRHFLGLTATPVTIDLPEDALARLHAEAKRRGVSIDLVIAELAEALPADSPAVPRSFSFVGLGSSTSGRYARDTDEILADGFGRN